MSARDRLDRTTADGCSVADMMLITDLVLFSLDHPAAVLIILTSDKDYLYTLSSLRNRGHRIVLVTANVFSKSMEGSADVHLDWRTLLGLKEREKVVPSLEARLVAPLQRRLGPLIDRANQAPDAPTPTQPRSYRDRGQYPLPARSPPKRSFLPNSSYLVPLPAVPRPLQSLPSMLPTVQYSHWSPYVSPLRRPTYVAAEHANVGKTLLQPHKLVVTPAQASQSERPVGSHEKGTRKQEKSERKRKEREVQLENEKLEELVLSDTDSESEAVSAFLLATASPLRRSPRVAHPFLAPESKGAEKRARKKARLEEANKMEEERQAARSLKSQKSAEKKRARKVVQAGLDRVESSAREGWKVEQANWFEEQEHVRMEKEAQMAIAAQAAEVAEIGQDVPMESTHQDAQAVEEFGDALTVELPAKAEVSKLAEHDSEASPEETMQVPAPLEPVLRKEVFTDSSEIGQDRTPSFRKPIDEVAYLVSEQDVLGGERDDSERTAAHSDGDGVELSVDSLDGLGFVDKTGDRPASAGWTSKMDRILLSTDMDISIDGSSPPAAMSAYPRRTMTVTPLPLAKHSTYKGRQDVLPSTDTAAYTDDWDAMREQVGLGGETTWGG